MIALLCVRDACVFCVHACISFRIVTTLPSPPPHATDKFTYLNDVWAVDVDTMTWHNPRCAGGGPSPRYGHTTTVIDFS